MRSFRQKFGYLRKQCVSLTASIVAKPAAVQQLSAPKINVSEMTFSRCAGNKIASQ